MPLSLQQAASATGKEKSTISRAIKSGRMSAVITESGTYQIDPAELFRVFPPKTAPDENTGSMQQNAPEQTGGATYETASEIRELKARLELLGEERTRERQQLEATISDLRSRLDSETAERRKLTALLTHQPANQNAPQADRTGVRPWLWIALAIAIAGAGIVLFLNRGGL